MRRFLALAVLVATASVVTSLSATAQEGGPRQAWARTGAVGPVAPAEGRIYVAQTAGQEQARAFVELPAGIDTATGELRLVEGDGGVASEGAGLTACALTEPLTGEGDVTADPPATDCAVQAPLRATGDGSWVLPLALFESRPGVAVVPVLEGAGPTFTVAFDTAGTTITAEAQPAPSPAPDETPAFDPVPTPGADPILAPVLEDPAAFEPPVEVRPPAPADDPPAPRAPRLGRGATEGVGSPPAAVLVIPVLVAAGVLWLRSRGRPGPLLPGAAVQNRHIGGAAGWLVLVALAMSFSEAAAYKFGFIAIVFVAVIGLHLLVNWAGELSLAHASFVGLPAFAVAQLADHTGWTPFLFLPVGVAVGTLLGLVVAIPALRTRGLQVALVTLAVAIAVTEFGFVRTWVIGPPSGLDIPVPSLFGVEFRTNRSMVPVLGLVVLLAVFLARGLLGSKVGRAMAQLRANPDAASAAGVPVARYRAAVYGMAGAFAGLAGGCYVFWVQRVGPQAFPLNLGFSYLVMATLAGKGGLAGVGISVFFLEGGRLFDVIPQSVGLYLGPIALIYNVTRYQEGINGLLRHTGRQLREVAPVNRLRQLTGGGIRLPAAVGFLFVVLGFAAIALAWYRAGNTDQLWIQNQELLSGGIGGGGLIVFGSALLIRDALLNGAARVATPDED